jgi:putative cardiolipin synthase
VGPIVRDVSKMYDYFWNGKWAVPISVIVKKKYTLTDLHKARKKLEEKIKRDRYPYPLIQDSRALQQHLKQLLKKFVWTKGEVIYNDPVQMKRIKSKQSSIMIDALHQRLDKVKKSVFVEAAYFIPGEEGMLYLKRMRERGVRVRILTNSLRSNDVLAAYAGYNTYRDELLEEGIELYELRDDAGSNKIINHNPAKGEVRSGLHAKIMVFDEKDVFVGSFNLDPRSSYINTEGGLYVQSPVLAKRIIAYMNEGIKPENAYHVKIDKNGHIIWVTVENGKEVIYNNEPKVSAWDKLKVNLFQLLPFEGQL